MPVLGNRKHEKANIRELLDDQRVLHRLKTCKLSYPAVTTWEPMRNEQPPPNLSKQRQNRVGPTGTGTPTKVKQKPTVR